MSLIDEALSANATIANGFDPSRGKPPKPMRTRSGRLFCRLGCWAAGR
jgi:hypothetical protein